LLEQEFGKHAPLTICRGRIHEYLGMTLDFSEDGKVKILMIDYITSLLEDYETEAPGDAASPAAAHLFDVSEQQERLCKEAAERFHTTTAKLLFLCKRARPDIQTAVAFLTTRVKAPDKDDLSKLHRVIRYLRATKYMPLVLEADGTHILKWWADAAFAVHPNMRSHTGGVGTMGRGAVVAMSAKQKLNSTSSTEGELIGAADLMPKLLWARYFLDAQGYDVTDNVLHQDNMSSIKLEQNGRASSGKRTRHINIRYFFIKDRIGSGELRVAYCPTEEMVADFFTKPLQGALFRKLRDQIMNVDPVTDWSQDHRSVLRIANPSQSSTESPATPRTVEAQSEVPAAGRRMTPGASARKSAEELWHMVATKRARQRRDNEEVEKWLDRSHS
jgi:hypothetical protein